jgi:hypothetical protein
MCSVETNSWHSKFYVEKLLKSILKIDTHFASRKLHFWKKKFRLLTKNKACFTSLKSGNGFTSLKSGCGFTSLKSGDFYQFEKDLPVQNLELVYTDVDLPV